MNPPQERFRQLGSVEGVESSSLRRMMVHSFDEFEFYRDRFLAAAENGTIFHSAWWHRAWGVKPTIRVLTDDRGQIQGGVCYLLGRKWGGNAILRPPLSPRNGPVFLGSAKKGRYARATHVKKMLLRTLQLLPPVSVHDLILCPGDIDVQPFQWNGFDTVVAYTYIIPRAETTAC